MYVSYVGCTCVSGTYVICTYIIHTYLICTYVVCTYARYTHVSFFCSAYKLCVWVFRCASELETLFYFCTDCNYCVVYTTTQTPFRVAVLLDKWAFHSGDHVRFLRPALLLRVLLWHAVSRIPSPVNGHSVTMLEPYYVDLSELSKEARKLRYSLHLNMTQKLCRFTMFVSFLFIFIFRSHSLRCGVQWRATRWPCLTILG